MSIIDEVMPISLIRLHCKLDDVVGVTDEQLKLYRSAAAEACEQYSGNVWFARRKHRQLLPIPRYVPGVFYQQKQQMTRLDYPVADGFVDLVNSGDTYPMTVPLGSIHVPNVAVVNASINCCSSCGNAPSTGQVYAEYNVGPSCAADVPAGIILGCLKFVAWMVEHPGDEFVPVMGHQSIGLRIKNGSVYGTNSGAAASGALDDWKRYRTTVVF